MRDKCWQCEEDLASDEGRNGFCDDCTEVFDGMLDSDDLDTEDQ